MTDCLEYHLYNKKYILGKESPFDEILQKIGNSMLMGVFDSLL